jgi:hypothetical protein
MSASIVPLRNYDFVPNNMVAMEAQDLLATMRASGPQALARAIAQLDDGDFLDLSTAVENEMDNRIAAKGWQDPEANANA